MAFSLFFPNEDGRDVCEGEILSYLNGAFAEYGESLELDIMGFNSLISELKCAPIDFPHVDGFQKASPFKKAAYLFAVFVMSRPFKQGFTSNIFPEEVRKIDNHQNVILAYNMVTDCLHGAKIESDEENSITLTNKIKVSKHFFMDLLHAARTPTASDYLLFSLLFESIAYQFNDVSYKRVI